MHRQIYLIRIFLFIVTLPAIGYSIQNIETGNLFALQIPMPMQKCKETIPKLEKRMELLVDQGNWKGSCVGDEEWGYHIVLHRKGVFPAPADPLYHSFTLKKRMRKLSMTMSLIFPVEDVSGAYELRQREVVTTVPEVSPFADREDCLIWAAGICRRATVQDFRKGKPVAFHCTCPREEEFAKNPFAHVTWLQAIPSGR